MPVPPLPGTLIQTLDSRNLVLASTALKGDSFMRGIRERDDVLLISISEEDRDQTVDHFLSTLLSPRPNGLGAG